MMVGDRINRLAERADQDGNTTKAKAVRKLLKMFNDGKIEAKIEKGRLYQVELAPEQEVFGLGQAAFRAEREGEGGARQATRRSQSCAGAWTK